MFLHFFVLIFTAETKPGTRIKVVSLESAQLQAELQRDIGRLAEQAIPPELQTNLFSDVADYPPPLLGLVDVCFVVDHHKFLCHKVSFLFLRHLFFLFFY